MFYMYNPKQKHHMLYIVLHAKYVIIKLLLIAFCMLPLKCHIYEGFSGAICTNF